MLGTYQADRGEAARRLACGPGKHLTLIDVSACDIQAGAAFERIRDFLQKPGYKGAQTAFVMGTRGSSITRKQLHRMISSYEGIEAFEEVAAAEAWLMVDPAYRTASGRLGTTWTSAPSDGCDQPARRAQTLL